MDSFLLAYQGKIVLAEQSADPKNRYIHLSVHKFLDAEPPLTCERCFKKTCQTKLQIGNSGEKFKILRFECIILEDTGLKNPCLLVQRGKANGPTEKYLELFLLSDLESKSPIIQKIGFFNLGVDNLSQVGVKLLDGPTVCWAVDHHVCLVGKESSTDDRLSLRRWAKVDSTSGVKNTTKPDILWCGNVDNRPVILVANRQLPDSSNTTETTSPCMAMNFIDVRKNKLFDCDGFPLVPDIYVGIASCCVVHTNNVLYVSTETAVKDSKTFSRDSESMNEPSKTSHVKVLVATTQAQLIEFHKGHFKRFWQLPFEDASSIDLAEVDGFELVAIVQSAKGRVCAINLSSQQVIREWNAVWRVFVDDFLRQGTEQVLVLSSLQTFGSTITDFTLTDFVQPEIIGNKEASICNVTSSVRSEECSESLGRTVHALEMRLQAGISSVVDAQIEYQEKQVMIKETCDNLHRIVSSHSSTSSAPEESTGMFCLLEGKTSEKADSVPKELDDVKPQITVEAIWQRVANAKWIVGAEIVNTGTRIITSISLALVSMQHEILTSSGQDEVGCMNRTLCDGGARADSVNKHKATFSDDILKLPTKKIKLQDADMNCCHGLLPGDKTTVVTVTDIPEFCYTQEYLCSPVLTYQSHGVSVCYQSMCCSAVTISASQLSDGHLDLGIDKDVISQKRDWMALEAVSIKTQLALTSSLTSLRHVDSLLRHMLAVSKDAVITVASVDEFDQTEPFPCPINGSGSLSGTCVLVQTGLREATLLLFARNLCQLYLLLHKLRQILPDDVTILSDTSQATTKTASVALRAMTSEVSNLTNGLSKVLRTRQEDIPMTINPSGLKGKKQEQVQTVRKELEKRRAQGSGSVTVNAASVRQLWDSVLKDQLETDVAVNSFVSVNL